MKVVEAVPVARLGVYREAYLVCEQCDETLWRLKVEKRIKGAPGLEASNEEIADGSVLYWHAYECVRCGFRKAF